MDELLLRIPRLLDTQYISKTLGSGEINGQPATLAAPISQPGIVLMIRDPAGLVHYYALVGNELFEQLQAQLSTVRRCRHCGCTDEDCYECIVRTGMPCCWVSEDACSACVEGQEPGAT